MKEQRRFEIKIEDKKRLGKTIWKNDKGGKEPQEKIQILRMVSVLGFMCLRMAEQQ